MREGARLFGDFEAGSKEDATGAQNVSILPDFTPRTGRLSAARTDGQRAIHATVSNVHERDIDRSGIRNGTLARMSGTIRHIDIGQRNNHSSIELFYNIAVTSLRLEMGPLGLEPRTNRL